MDQFNKAISFFLGLIVVVVFLAVATGKINLKGKTLPFLKGTTTSVTPTPTQNVISTVTYKETTAQNKPTPATQQSAQYRRYDSAITTAGTIPNTGPELLLPLIVSSFFGGSFLKKMSQKK